MTINDFSTQSTTVIYFNDLALGYYPDINCLVTDLLKESSCLLVSLNFDPGCFSVNRPGMEF